MNKIIEMDSLKLQNKELQKMYLEALNKLDKIKNKLVSNDKVSKSSIRYKIGISLVHPYQSNEPTISTSLFSRTLIRSLENSLRIMILISTSGCFAA